MARANTIRLQMIRPPLRFGEAKAVANRVLEDYLTNVAERIKGALEQLVEDWEYPPEFEVDTISTAHKGAWSRTVTVQLRVAGDEKAVIVFNALDKGAKSHTITGDPYLWFPDTTKHSYKARTKQGRLWTDGYGAFNKTRAVRVAKVKHPGNEPREFLRAANEEYGLNASSTQTLERDLGYAIGVTL